MLVVVVGLGLLQLFLHGEPQEYGLLLSPAPDNFSALVSTVVFLNDSDGLLSLSRLVDLLPFLELALLFADLDVLLPYLKGHQDSIDSLAASLVFLDEPDG